MSLTLGEKLREAREARGFTLSEVAEQTRISPLYLESIENNDYSILPGGIFNKGFVKSYAKFVGINEQDALLEYTNLVSGGENVDFENQKTYRPEVLIDGGQGRSIVPTAITAIVILGLMTGGILLLLNYLRQPNDRPAPAVVKSQPDNQNEAPAADSAPEATPAGAVDMAGLTVEIKALAQPVKIITTIDSEPATPVNITAGASTKLNPKQSLTVNYLRWNTTALELTLNGKPIALPSAPLDPKDKDRIIFTISKENLAEIMNAGAIGTSPVSGPAAPANTSPAAVPPKPATTPAPKPSAPANTAANSAAKSPANTAKPPTMTAKPSPKPPIQ